MIGHDNANMEPIIKVINIRYLSAYGSSLIQAAPVLHEEKCARPIMMTGLANNLEADAETRKSIGSLTGFLNVQSLNL